MNRTEKQQREHIRRAVLAMVAYFGTQAEVARIAKCKPPSVHYWVAGTKRPGLPSLLRIEKASKGAFKARDIRPELF
jgi:DNA-binding transcriptional regulator YdaS (Cro superfamily)